MSWPDPIRLALSLRVDADPSHGELRDGLAQDWAACLHSWHVIPHLMPNRWKHPEDLLRRWNIQAILLTGGNTPIQPDGEIPADASAERDSTEAAMIEYAREHSLPLLAICRGAQMLNVHLGGRLQPMNPREEHVAAIHEIRFTDSFVEEPIRVNSFHNHGIFPEDLAGELQMLARATDGSIEAYRHEQLPWLAVLWHPERAGNTPRQIDSWLAGHLHGLSCSDHLQPERCRR